jgi:hypothetical protein
MSARDKIAEIIMANRAVDNWQGPTPADVDLADAILAAMPDMIAPLVWEVDKYGRGFIARSVAGTYGSWDEGSPRWYPPTQGEARYRGARSLEEAQAAANAHHRAAIMAALNGEAKT